MKSAQEFMHWLELGSGARWIRLGAVLAGTVALSLLVAWRQFHGPASESTLEQADVGRQLADGHGFTTLINYPQTEALLESRGRQFDARQPLPELHHAPLYSIVIAGALRLLPAGMRARLFAAPAQVTDGYGGDAFLLSLNLVLFWVAAALTWLLAARLFTPRAGWLAAFGLLVSAPLWKDALSLDGTPLLMDLALAAFLVWHRIEDAAGAAGTARRSSGDDSGSRGIGWGDWGSALALGGTTGLLFLADYSAGVLMPVALGYVLLRFRGGRRVTLSLCVVAGFMIVAAPWAWRNVVVSGNPVGLAADNVALKAGDPTAEPAVVRTTLAPHGPDLSLRKLGNKTLATLQEDLQTRLWSGAMWFGAFFAAGWLYSFRSTSTNRMRWTFVVALAVLLVGQASLNSGETERHVATWCAPLIIVFGAGFFFVLLGANVTLNAWPRAAAAVLLGLQALPLVHEALAPPPVIRFVYPPYLPALMRGMRAELESRGSLGSFGIMADVPAGVAWYAEARTWAKPSQISDFYAINIDQTIGELLLTPETLDKPFFTELKARPTMPFSPGSASQDSDNWGQVYAGLLTGAMPSAFPLTVSHKVADNLVVLLSPALPPEREK